MATWEWWEIKEKRGPIDISSFSGLYVPIDVVWKLDSKTTKFR